MLDRSRLRVRLDSGGTLEADAPRKAQRVYHERAIFGGRLLARQCLRNRNGTDLEFLGRRLGGGGGT